MDWPWIISNSDRIGAYILLLAGVWALITGRLITVGRLADWQELVRLLREENAQLRGAVDTNNQTIVAVKDQMTETNRVLAGLANHARESGTGRGDRGP